jgi:uncharacterized protein YeaO (DUF488 family)
MAVFVKHLREKRSPSDGLRVLLERRWPPLMKKSEAAIDLWLPQLAISERLERIIGLTRAELSRRYYLQLRRREAEEALIKLYSAAARRKTVTLLHAQDAAETSAAGMLQPLLEGSKKPPTGSGPAAAAGSRTRAVRRR